MTAQPQAQQQLPQSRLPIRRVVAVAFVCAALAGGIGHFLAGDTRATETGVETLVTVQATVEPQATVQELPAPTHVPGHDGYGSVATAQHHCETGTVSPLYRHGEIRGWTCITTVIGGGQ